MRRCKLKKCGKLFEPFSHKHKQLFCSTPCRIIYFNRKREKHNKQRKRASIQANPLPPYNVSAYKDRPYLDCVVLDRDLTRRSYKHQEG
jgi:hypothetical protein